MAAVGDLQGGAIRVAIDDDDLDAKPLQLNHDFLTELTAAAEQNTRRRGSKRGANRGHR